jgi:hypothetical protein
MNFDLNINNYTKDELIQMFELPNFFDINLFEIQETKLKDNILKNKQINKETQIKTIEFLQKAKNIILNDFNKNYIEQSELNIKDDLNLLEKDKYYSNYKLNDTIIENESGNHDIQKKEKDFYSASFPSDIYQGVINPLKKRLVYKNVVIDTRFRDNYYSSTSTNFSFFMPTQFNSVVSLKLSNLIFPCYFYSISKTYGNNFFSINVTNNNITNTAIVTIPDGCYDPVSVTKAINSSLNFLSEPFNKVVFNVGVNESSVISSYLLGDNRMYVGTSLETITEIELNFQTDINGTLDIYTQLPLKLGWMLGFRNGSYKGSINYISEGLIDVYGPKYIYFILDDYQNNVSKNFYGMLNSSILNNNILARFSMLSLNKPFSYYIDDLSTNESAPPREYFGPVNLYNMNLQIVDEYGRTIDLNNMDYSFTLKLNCIYDI